MNTFWTIANNVEFGVEYRYGKRITFTPDEGTQHRLNASFHVNLL